MPIKAPNLTIMLDQYDGASSNKESVTIMLDQYDGASSSKESDDEKMPVPQLDYKISTSDLNQTDSPKITEEGKLTFTVEQLQLFQTRYEIGYVKCRTPASHSYMFSHVLL